MVSLNQPFVSEAYDRLIEARAVNAESARLEREQAAINNGAKLKAARAGLGLTQSALADRLGLTGAFIGMMERDDKPIEPRTDLSIRYLLTEPRA